MGTRYLISIIDFGYRNKDLMIMKKPQSLGAFFYRLYSFQHDGNTPD